MVRSRRSCPSICRERGPSSNSTRQLSVVTRRWTWEATSAGSIGRGSLSASWRNRTRSITQPLRSLPQSHAFFKPVRDAAPFGELGQTPLFHSNQFRWNDLAVYQNSA